MPICPTWYICIVVDLATSDSYPPHIYSQEQIEDFSPNLICSVSLMQDGLSNTAGRGEVSTTSSTPLHQTFM